MAVVLSDDAWHALRQELLRLRHSSTQVRTAKRTAHPAAGSRAVGQWVARIGGTAITAAVGNTPGTGTVTLRRKGLAATLSDYNDGTGVTKTVFSWSTKPTPINVNCFVTQDFDGVLWLIAVDCP